MITSRLEQVDRETAELYLSYEVEPAAGVKGANRSHSPELVRYYAKIMLKGKWELTHQGIAFHEDGRLVDGGHRLRAIIKAAEVRPDITVPMMVSEGLSDAAVLALDIGRRRRPGDFLTMAGETSGNFLAAAIRLSYMYENGEWGGVYAYRKFSLTPAQQAAYLEENPELPDAVRRASSSWTVVTVTAASSFLFLGEKHSDSEAVNEMLQQLRNGNGPNWSEGNPVHRLREMLLRADRRHRALTSPEQLALMIKAFNRWREGKQVRGLVFRSDEEFPRFREEKA